MNLMLQRNMNRYTSLSAEAKLRMRAAEPAPLLRGDWMRSLFIHYEVDPVHLQPLVPFELDLHEGKAYVSLVAFQMHHMRPHAGGRLAAWLCKPVANHAFLNVRTYVIRDGEPGIFFLAEWLPNLLSVIIGPRTFGLPYRYGALSYEHTHESGLLSGDVNAKASDGGREHLSYRAEVDPDAGFQPCEADSLSEFLLERYTAYTHRLGVYRRFRVWHEPWPQMPVEVEMLDERLLRTTGEWIDHAAIIGANYSTGVVDVELGRPQCINGAYCDRAIDRITDK